MLYIVGECINTSFNSLKNSWQDIVRDPSLFVFANEFEYDTKNFLYLRSRAITANQINVNGDYFPAEEVEKAYKTFIGKGVYWEHNEDSPDKSFGIILDAHWFPEFRYVEILAALDKEKAEQIQPGIISDIENNRLTAGSMSALAGRSRCSYCGNWATNKSQLCIHSHPDSAFRIKGKLDPNGNICYDENYDLTFLGWSIVKIPAFYDSRIFAIYSSANKEEPVPNKLYAHFNKYQLHKLKRGAMSEKEQINLQAENKEEKKDIVEEATENLKKDVEKKEDIVDKKESVKDVKKVGLKAEEKEEDLSTKKDTIESIYKNLGKIIKEQVERKVELKIKQIIDDEIRKELSDEFAKLDQSLRPKIETKVENVSEGIKREIHTLQPDTNIMKSSWIKLKMN